MYAGTVVEQIDTATLISGATHPYTKLLIRAIPSYPSDGRRLETVPNESRPQSMTGGCVFAARCPEHLGEICEVGDVPLVTTGPRHEVRCYLASGTPVSGGPASGDRR